MSKPIQNKSGKALEALLQHPKLWRASNTLQRVSGASSAAHAVDVLDTGYRQLNEALYSGGWPLGNLLECLSPLTRAGIGQGPLQLFLPALQNPAQRPVVLVSPPHIPFLPGWPLLHGNGEHAKLPPLWVVTPADNKQLLWASEQILQSNSASAVFIWLEQPRQLRSVYLRKLQLAARQGEALAVLFRGADALQQPSPAPLRLLIEPVASAQGMQLEVTIAKQPGGWGGQQTRIAWHSRLQRPVMPAARWPVHRPAEHMPPGGAGSEQGLPLLGMRAAKWS